MVTSSSKLSYEDCFEILDRALASSKGIKLSVESESAGYHLRNRINYARSADRKANAETYDPGHPLHGCSTYDTLTIKLRVNGNRVYLLVEKISLNVEIEDIK